jgi:uncharacterized surface protein with fasciclin (FAS1) repeats
MKNVFWSVIMNTRALITALIVTGAMTSGTVTANARTIVDVAASTGQFNTLLAAAKAAGLAGTLSGPGHFTVFAPTDAAFAKLPAGTVANLLKPQNKSKLRALLKYHVIGKKIRASQIPVGATHVTTLNGRAVSVRKQGGVRVNSANVVTADVGASNGVIHVIDKVLIPR